LEGFIRSYLSAERKCSAKYTPGFLDSYIVNKFVDGIVALLHDVVGNPDHEVRRRFDTAVDEFIDRLNTSADYRDQAEALKQELLAHLDREVYYQVVWNDIKERLVADLSGAHSSIRTQLAEAFVKLGSALRDDLALQVKLNTWLLQAIEALLVQHRHQVSTLITEVVRGWDAREVAEKLELEIGKDLQYIRISGTLVGGSVGLLLHAVTGLM